MIKTIKRITILSLMILLSTVMYAQTPPHPGGGGAPAGGDPPVGAPLDGGLLLLLSFGAAYGLKKWDIQKIVK